jgi:riboflavin synthase
MFSGIIETIETIITHQPLLQAHQIVIRRPPLFNDLSLGDSIAINGICLTVESFDSDSMTFTLGFETLKVLGPTFDLWLQRPLNLERSLAFGARVHGHFVTGHVEAMVDIVKSESLGENWLVSVVLPPELKKFCWKKGSVALNGVSLTINSVENNIVEVCLIPETQKRTNLVNYKVGEQLCFEPDSFAKAIANALENGLICSGGSDVQ